LLLQLRAASSAKTVAAFSGNAGSHDMSRTIRGVRCRINILQTARASGSPRLAGYLPATVEKLNLHPDLKKAGSPNQRFDSSERRDGQWQISTLAALIQEINLPSAAHLTIESPIEYTFVRVALHPASRMGRDTPSFDQALLDSLREDPDVLMVERCAILKPCAQLNAAETGHLCCTAFLDVLGACSAWCRVSRGNPEAAWPRKSPIGLVAWFASASFQARVEHSKPDCEILMLSHGVKNFIRNRDSSRSPPRWNRLDTGCGLLAVSWLVGPARIWFIPGQTPEPRKTAVGEAGSGAACAMGPGA